MENNNLPLFIIKNEPLRTWLAKVEVVVSQTVVKLHMKLANGLSMQLHFKVVQSSLAQ